MKQPNDWLCPPPSWCLSPGQIQVWQFTLDLPETILSELTELLDEDEKSRLQRLRAPIIQHRYIVAHGTLRRILSTYLDIPPRAIAFHYGPHGKPALAVEDRSIRFNLSHSHDLALVAVALDREVGVDLEQLRANWTALKLAERFFTPGEAMALGDWPEPEQQLGFTLAWTRKEAVTKARGKSIFHEIRNIEVDLRPENLQAAAKQVYTFEGRTWAVCDLPGFKDNYVAALAAEGLDWSVQCWQWPV